MKIYVLEFVCNETEVPTHDLIIASLSMSKLKEKILSNYPIYVVGENDVEISESSYNGTSYYYKITHFNE